MERVMIKDQPWKDKKHKRWYMDTVQKLGMMSGMKQEWIDDVKDRVASEPEENATNQQEHEK